MYTKNGVSSWRPLQCFTIISRQFVLIPLTPPIKHQIPHPSQYQPMTSSNARGMLMFLFDQWSIHYTFHYQYAPKWWNDCPLSVKYYLLSVLQIGHLYSSMTSRHVHVRHIASAYHIIIVCLLLQVLTDFERLQRPLHGYFNSFKRI